MFLHLITPTDLYQLRFLMPQKIKNLAMVNTDIEIKEQIERSEDMRHFIS